MLAKVTAHDPSWQALKARADVLATYPVQYKKQVRWHVPERPAVAGNVARVDHGDSRLFIETLLPSNATLAVVDEWKNPDPCDGTVPGCAPFGANAATFRVEVADRQNPLFVPFLTVLQPGAATATPPADALISTADGKMTGLQNSQELVLFNNQSGQVPAPITSTSYKFTGPGSAVHILLGLAPGAAYSVTLINGVVHVDQSASGTKTASPAGVLRFTFAPGRRRAVRR